MKYLFIHPNFPGQFKHVAAYLARQGHQVVGLGQTGNIAKLKDYPAEVALYGYEVARGTNPGIHHYLVHAERDVLHGQGVAKACLELGKKGFYPDVICVHLIWGAGLYLREIFPKARITGYAEMYYRAQGTVMDFDPEFQYTLDQRCQQRSKNFTQLLSMSECDACWSPTQWQASIFPPEYHSKIRVIHEGIDTKAIHSDPEAFYTLPNGRRLTSQDEVLTLVNRNMEPYRGFHVFMRTLPEIQRRRPDAITVIIGAEDNWAYGNKPANGKSWREVMLEEVGSRLDMSRLFFVGELGYQEYLRILQISRAHVYMTYPYCLSWSMLESMASECLLIASNTPPVVEMVRHQENGLLFDFFDQQGLADRVEDALNNPDKYMDLRRNARQTVIERYDLETVCLPQQIQLLTNTSFRTGSGASATLSPM